MLKMFTYFEDKWYDGNPALLRPKSHAFWLGSMVFDGARSWNKNAPDLDLHAARVVQSAKLMGLNPKKTVNEIVNLMIEGIGKFDDTDSIYLRPMFWPVNYDSWPILFDPDSCQFALHLYTSPFYIGKPISLGLCSTIRRPTPESAPTDIKASCHYANSTRGSLEMKKQGFDSGIVLDPLGYVAETISSNVFIVKNNIVLTPVPNGTFLAGITRHRVIDLLRKNNYTVYERIITVHDLDDADEIFTTGNAHKIQPVCQFKEKSFKVGPVSQEVCNLYLKYAESQKIT